MDFSVVTNEELINELQSRGYKTDLLFCREDVQSQIDSYNEDREEEFKIPVEMDEDEMDQILDEISVDWYTQQINEEIFDKVFSYFVGEDGDEDL